MANILTAAEAAIVLRCEPTDPAMLQLLPLVDVYLRNATGRDWTRDNPVNTAAKSAAQMLLVLWHEDPGRIGNGTALNFGLTGALVQLEAIAMQSYNFEGTNGAGYISLIGARPGDTVASLTGLIGLSGDQASLFETVISVDDCILQLSTSDLTGKYFRAQLKPLSEL